MSEQRHGRSSVHSRRTHGGREASDRMARLAHDAIAQRKRDRMVRRVIREVSR